jgi:hypothetical protein
MTFLVVWDCSKRVSLREVDAGQRHRAGSVSCADTGPIRTPDV